MTVPPQTRADDVLRLARNLGSLDPDDRGRAAQSALDWSHSGALVPVQREPVAQVCVWAWVIEGDADVAETLMWAIGTLGWNLAPGQVMGVARILSGTEIADAGEDFLDDLDDYLRREPDAMPRLLDEAACGRAIDLVRGLTSTDAGERLSAARLAADVVASRDLADEEAGCFAGLLSYAVVIEFDATVRHEQAIVLAIAAHHGRLSDDHRGIALAADLTDEERAAIAGTDPTRSRQGT